MKQDEVSKEDGIENSRKRKRPASKKSATGSTKNKTSKVVETEAPENDDEEYEPDANKKRKIKAIEPKVKSMANVKQAKKSKSQKAVLENKKKKKDTINGTDHEDEVPNDMQSKSKTRHKHSKKSPLLRALNLRPWTILVREMILWKHPQQKLSAERQKAADRRRSNSIFQTRSMILMILLVGRPLLRSRKRVKAISASQKQGHGEIEVGQ